MTDATADELQEFLAESEENLDRFDHDLLALEADPHDIESIGSAFRAIHTLKGTCGFLGFARLEALAHDGETLLAKVRDGAVSMDRAVADALFALEDAVRRSLAVIAQVGDEGDEEWTQLRERLRGLALEPGRQGSATTQPLPDVRGAAGKAAQPQAEPVAAAVEVETVAGATAATTAASGERSKTVGERSRVVGSEGAVRVDVALLDRLMNLVGELVLARNRVLQLAQSMGGASLLASTQQLSIITSELQEQVMKTRMQPIDMLFAKLPRVVRDLALELGREVELELEGRETELDRTIIDAIRDPLTHLVRNALDHGIEPPEERERSGKPRRGLLHIEAYHEGGYVLVEVRDDGRGIDLAGVAKRALERGLLTREELAQRSPREVADLIFLPGFSTATSVSAVSGRGVGMDVVKTNVEAVGGSIDIESERGRGTIFRLRIPLTLAIIPALMVEMQGQRFAIPQLALSELVRLELGQDDSLVDVVDHTPVLRRREQLVPLLDLGSLLGLAPAFTERGVNAVSVVILQLGGRGFGLVVDRIVDTQEIVVKPLGQFVNQLPCYSGATILGDGRVALILDIAGLAHLGGLGVDRDEERTGEALADVDFDSEAVLVLSAGGSERVGVLLRAIERLEQFEPSSIEHVNGREVLQYRGAVLPLVALSHLLGLPSHPANPQRVDVVVANHRGVPVGLVVDEVLDIASVVQTGTGGTVIVDGRLVRLVDVEELLDGVVEPDHV